MSEPCFIDASCPRCKAHIGWYGTVLDHPECHRCGYQPGMGKMKHDQEEMDSFWELLNELRQANPSWDKWRKARVAAGLTLRQAAKILEVTPTDLSKIEQGQSKPSESLAARMASCYGG